MPRPKWVDPFICAVFVLLMAWVAFDFYSVNGMGKFLLVPLFFGVTPCIFVFLLRQPIEVFVMFLIWLVACLCFLSGIFQGETWLPSKHSELLISLDTSPVMFLVAMAINLLVVGVGIGLGISAVRKSNAL